MKVLVIGDSYGLPRYAKNSFNVELDYAGTYPEQLRECSAQILPRMYVW